MAKTLGRDGIIGSNVITGKGFEFRSHSDAEDYLVKWTTSAGAVKAKVSGTGYVKSYSDPSANEDVSRKSYDAATFLPLAGGTMTGSIDLNSTYKITGLAAATTDTDAVSRSAADARFLKLTDAASTYLTQASANSTYLTQASAVANFAPKTGSTTYATQSQLSNYATVSQLSSYAPASGSTNYAPASGSSNYAPASGSSSYLSTANPTFTGQLKGPCVRPSYIASPSLPLSGTHGILFNTTTAGGFTQGPTYMYMCAPDVTNAAFTFIKNKTNGTTEYVPCYGTSFSNPSELILKNLIGELSDALGLISNLVPYRFSLKSDPDNTPQIGFIVENIEPVVPEVVSQAMDHKAIDYARLVTLAIAAIKELTARVEALEARS